MKGLTADEVWRKRRHGLPRRTLLLAVGLITFGSTAGAFECLIQPAQVIEIRSPVEGLISKITVQRGDTIRHGQLLVELQSDAERSAVESARYRAQMAGRAASARHRLEYAIRKLKRVAELSEENILAMQARDDAEAEKQLAESELQDAVENIELARIEHRHAQDLLNMRALQSPIDGVVVERMLNVGDIAEAGTGRKPILKVAQIDPLHVEVLLPIEALGRVSLGMQGRVTAEGVGSVQVATVKVIDRVVDAASGTFGVRLELPNPRGKLPGGLRCHVDLEGFRDSRDGTKATGAR